MRLTFKETAFSDQFLKCGVIYHDIPMRVVRDLRDLPIEISDDVVSSFFLSSGKVLSVTRSKLNGFPALCDGNRVVKMALDKDIPYFVRIANFDCRFFFLFNLAASGPSAMSTNP